MPSSRTWQGAIIYGFMGWFRPVEESDVKAVMEFMAQNLPARAPDANNLQ